MKTSQPVTNQPENGIYSQHRMRAISDVRMHYSTNKFSIIGCNVKIVQDNVGERLLTNRFCLNITVGLYYTVLQNIAVIGVCPFSTLDTFFLTIDSRDSFDY